MIFKKITNWREVEAELIEQGFGRQKRIIIHEIWYRLQIENVVKEYTPKELEDALGIVAEAYDELEE